MEISEIEQALDREAGGCASSEPFALQVLGDSMEPEFPDKCIIIIDPAKFCGNGAYVFAEVEGERWFRRYVKTADGEEKLVALNPNYPEIPLNGRAWQVHGIIVQRNVKRKIKHYTNY